MHTDSVTVYYHIHNLKTVLQRAIGKHITRLSILTAQKNPGLLHYYYKCVEM